MTKKRSALAAFTIVLMTNAAVAQERRNLVEATLEELLTIPVVTASRVTEQLKDAPARMVVVTDAEIRRRGYRSLTDVLKDLPDFKVDIAGDQDYPVEFTIQGSRGSSRVIVLLDGIRISSPTNEPLPIAANFPVHSARQIEVLYGPASALYGADAFAAIVNIISKDGFNSDGLWLETSMGQDGLYNETASYTAQLGPSSSLLLAGQFLHDRQPDLSRVYPADFQGLRAQHTGTFNTIFGPMRAIGPVSPDYDVPLSAHSMQATLRAGGLQLSLFENESHIPTTPAYTPDNGVYNNAAFNENSLLVVSGSYAKSMKFLTSTSTLTMSRHELDPESGYWNVYSNLKKSYKYAFGSMLKGEQQFAWKPGSATTLTTGVTVERFFAIPQGADLNAPIGSRDRPGTILDTDIQDDFIRLRYSNSGAYAQLQHAITPRLTGVLGARGDYNARYGGTFNPRLGLVARPAADTTIKMLYGTAYLAPSPYQSYGHYGAFYSEDGGQTYASEYWHLPNPDLKPQKKRTFEVNMVQGLGASFAVSATAFHSLMTDVIQESDPRQPSAGLYHGWPVAYIDFPVNEGDQNVYGATIGLNFVKPLSSGRGINARAALSLADGDVSSHDANGTSMRLPVGGMAPVQLKFGVDLHGDRLDVTPRVTVSGRQRLRATESEGDSLVRRTLPGYATVDVNVRRRDVFKELDLFVTVENALDMRYRHINMRAYSNPEELVGAPQNPRRITVGAQFQVPR